MSRHPRDRLRRDRVAVTVAFGSYGLLPGAWAGRLPAVAQDRGLAVGTLGLLLLAPAVGAVLAMPLAGGVLARLGRRRVFVASGLVTCATVPLLAWAPGSAGFAVTLVLYGAAGGALDVALNAQAVDVEHAAGRPLLNGMHAAWSLGAFAGSGLSGASAAAGLSSGGWLLTAALVAAVALTGCGLSFTSYDVADPGEAPRLALPDRRTALLGLLAFCSLFVESAAADWSGVYLHDGLGTSVAAAAAGFTVFSVAMVVGRLGGDTAVHRFGAARTVRVAAGAGAVALGAGLLTGTVGPVLVGLAVGGLGTATLFPTAIAAAGRRTADPGTGVAAVATLGYLGWLAAPGAIGTFAAATSLAAALGLAAGLLAVASVAVVTLRSRPAPAAVRSPTAARSGRPPRHGGT